uniref:Uncharacterized protein n=1 Tax=Eutreptiella gymnastica TaxID=73025 RepID=A0A7S4LDN6_9EUGL
MTPSSAYFFSSLDFIMTGERQYSTLFRLNEDTFLTALQPEVAAIPRCCMDSRGGVPLGSRCFTHAAGQRPQATREPSEEQPLVPRHNWGAPSTFSSAPTARRMKKPSPFTLMCTGLGSPPPSFPFTIPAYTVCISAAAHWPLTIF